MTGTTTVSDRLKIVEHPLVAGRPGVETTTSYASTARASTELDVLGA